jgi:hypothetical protein
MLIANKLRFIRLFKSSIGHSSATVRFSLAKQACPYGLHANLNSMLTKLVGLFAALLLAANAQFQLALAAGVPCGSAVHGSKVAQDDATRP